MPLTYSKIAVAALGAALSASICAAQAPKPAPDGKGQVGKTVDSAVESIKKTAGAAGDAIREQYEKARGAVHSMGVASRVYGRLHWDKALTNYRIDVDVRRDGATTLTGAVGDAVARAKAVELAQGTVGVTSVVDNMTIAPSSPGNTPATTPPAKP